eukprot:6192322-Pleurochrysis_carterae.AAC.6
MAMMPAAMRAAAVGRMALMPGRPVTRHLCRGLTQHSITSHTKRCLEVYRFPRAATALRSMGCQHALLPHTNGVAAMLYANRCASTSSEVQAEDSTRQVPKSLIRVKYYDLATQRSRLVQIAQKARSLVCKEPLPQIRLPPPELIGKGVWWMLFESEQLRDLAIDDLQRMDVWSTCGTFGGKLVVAPVPDAPEHMLRCSLERCTHTNAAMSWIKQKCGEYGKVVGATMGHSEGAWDSGEAGVAFVNECDAEHALEYLDGAPSFVEGVDLSVEFIDIDGEETDSKVKTMPKN